MTANTPDYDKLWREYLDNHPGATIDDPELSDWQIQEHAKLFPNKKPRPFPE